jgi:hypothetical protein
MKIFPRLNACGSGTTGQLPGRMNLDIAIQMMAANLRWRRVVKEKSPTVGGNATAGLAAT